MRIIKEISACKFGSYLFEFSNNEHLQLIKSKTTINGFDLFMKQMEEDIRSYFIDYSNSDYEYKYYFNSYDELGIDEGDIDFFNNAFVPFFKNLYNQYQELYNLMNLKVNSYEEYRLVRCYITENNNIVVNIRYKLPFV